MGKDWSRISRTFSQTLHLRIEFKLANWSLVKGLWHRICKPLRTNSMHASWNSDEIWKAHKRPPMLAIKNLALKAPNTNISGPISLSIHIGDSLDPHGILLITSYTAWAGSWGWILFPNTIRIWILEVLPHKRPTPYSIWIFWSTDASLPGIWPAQVRPDIRVRLKWHGDKRCKDTLFFCFSTNCSLQDPRRK